MTKKVITTFAGRQLLMEVKLGWKTTHGKRRHSMKYDYLSWNTDFYGKELLVKVKFWLNMNFVDV